METGRNLLLSISFSQLCCSVIFQYTTIPAEKKWFSIASAAELWYADAQRGVGRAAIQQARRIAGTRGAQYLRLFTLPVNTPAIRFYERVGFTRAADIHEEVVDAALTLQEYGFEIETADGKNKTETEL